jgi:hypothetical protein
LKELQQKYGEEAYFVDDSLGYDIFYYDGKNEYKVEVKTMTNLNCNIIFSIREIKEMLLYIW